MTQTTTATDLANVPHPAGATDVAEWYDDARYFTGTQRLV